MAKIGRNEPCPCGSGKKYKHCHIAGDQENPLQQPSFEEMVTKYHSEPILKLLGVLQLLPVNHGQEAQLEERARLTLLQRKENDERPFASWQMLNAVIGPMGYFNDAPTNALPKMLYLLKGIMLFTLGFISVLLKYSINYWSVFFLNPMIFRKPLLKR